MKNPLNADPKFIEKVIELREQRKNFRDIAKELGISYTWVAKLIKKHAPHLSGKIKYPELEEEETFVHQSDEQIAQALGVPQYRVAAARRKLGLMLKPSTDVNKRRIDLSRAIFNAEPGPNFCDFLTDKVMPSLAPRQQQLIFNFYIEPSGNGSSELVNSATNRVYRSAIRKIIKEHADKANKEELVAEGVILNGTSDIEGDSLESSNSMGS